MTQPAFGAAACAPGERDRVRKPCSAAFVPPPPERVPGLLDDLAGFCNTDSLPAVTQAALAHAQFETIHPFLDGNGRCAVFAQDPEREPLSAWVEENVL